MNNKFKKLLSVILCAAMLLTTASVAFAAEEYEHFTEGLFTYRTKAGEAIIVKCDTSAVGDVVIPNLTQSGYPVCGIIENAFEDCTGITCLAIGENISFLNNAFPGCSSLEKFIADENNKKFFTDEYGVLYGRFEISDSIYLAAYPSANKSEHYTVLDEVWLIKADFENCANLKTLTVPESVREVKDCSFNNCPKLTDIYYGGTQRKWASNDGVWTLPEGVTLHCREESLFEKIEAEIDIAIGKSNIPWGFIIYCISYAFLFLFGTVISPVTLPISLILQLFNII